MWRADNGYDTGQVPSHKVFCHDSCFSYWLINFAYDMIARLNWWGPTFLGTWLKQLFNKNFLHDTPYLELYLQTIARFPLDNSKYDVNIHSTFVIHKTALDLCACGTDLGARSDSHNYGRKEVKIYKGPSSLSLHNFCTYQSMLLWCKFID